MTSSRPLTGSLRVIGGKWRSRKLQFPAVNGLRPTGDRIRETLFNWLQNDVPAARCLDLFAGSGACGIEALSRGAQQVVFVEKDPAAAQSISSNLLRLESEGAQVVCTDALSWLNTAVETAQRFDIVFVDPPYALNLLPEVLARLASGLLLKPGAKLYLESGSPLGMDLLSDPWVLLKNKQAGAVHYYLIAYSPTGTGSLQ